MKKAFSLIVVFLAFATVSFAQKGVIKFTKESHDFGKVPQGTPVTHTFEFTNTGTDPVVISQATPSCGCTTPDWTKSAVMPGQKGFVKATYNAASMGSFNKNVTVVSNGERSSIPLTLTGEVVSKETAAASPAAPGADKNKKKGTR
ncbi:DUF1573 domain-containing protein [Larkinella arboricola]|uniref:Uncharacterized protein DUF1573 n=1 Tax=Larkinella arboricola TaxID=643671 RepID=A0A327X8M4_LARAB|nr:DUF1573 domain-containing protein [Larkinella arboricola]RAK02233.1 uncharacterized protein DUF1573 [Larkinella arboricola]